MKSTVLNSWKCCFEIQWCLPRNFAYIPAFRIEFLAKSGAEKQTNHRNNSERVLQFHCTSSSILLDSCFTPHSPSPAAMVAFHWVLNTPVWSTHIIQMMINWSCLNQILNREVRWKVLPPPTPSTNSTAEKVHSDSNPRSPVEGKKSHKNQTTTCKTEYSSWVPFSLRCAIDSTKVSKRGHHEKRMGPDIP